MNQTWENGEKTNFGTENGKKPSFGSPIFFLFSKIWLHQSLDIMVSYNHLQYQKKLMIQSWQNLVTNGQMDRQTEGPEWFHRACPTKVEQPKISKVENKMPHTSTLLTKTISFENKIPDDSKYITTLEFNKLRAENFAARLKQADLENKTDFDNKLKSFNRWITSNKMKRSEVQKKLNSLIMKDYNFFLGRIILQVMMDLKTHMFIKQHLIC